jgi:hypothetical protein
VEVKVADYTLKRLYWNNYAGHDKIWGWVKTPNGNLFCFWGKRSVVDTDGMTPEGKRPSLQFKKHTSEYDLSDLARSKVKKGYREVAQFDVDRWVPGFTAFFDYALVTARMTGKVRTDDWD